MCLFKAFVFIKEMHFYWSKNSNTLEGLRWKQIMQLVEQYNHNIQIVCIITDFLFAYFISYQKI